MRLTPVAVRAMVPLTVGSVRRRPATGVHVPAPATDSEAVHCFGFWNENAALTARAPPFVVMPRAPAPLNVAPSHARLAVVRVTPLARSTGAASVATGREADAAAGGPGDRAVEVDAGGADLHETDGVDAQREGAGGGDAAGDVDDR